MSNKKIIYKQILEPKEVQIISLQKESNVLSVANQRGKACIWYICDPEEKEMEDRIIETVPTGVEFDSTDKRFIGTALFHDGAIVFHYWEK